MKQLFIVIFAETWEPRPQIATSGNVAAEALIAAADSIQNFDCDFDSIYAIIFPHGLRSLWL